LIFPRQDIRVHRVESELAVRLPYCQHNIGPAASSSYSRLQMNQSIPSTCPEQQERLTMHFPFFAKLHRDPLSKGYVPNPQNPCHNERRCSPTLHLVNRTSGSLQTAID